MKKSEALKKAQEFYGQDIYLLDSWVENEWHVMKVPEVWQGNILFLDKWYIEIPEFEGNEIVGSNLKEVK